MTTTAAPMKNDAVASEKSYGPLTEALLRLRKNKIAVAGIIIIALFLVMALFSRWIAPHDPLAQSLYDKLKPPVWDDGGTWTYPLGTDDFGRDLLSRIIYGSRISMMVGVTAVSISLFSAPWRAPSPASTEGRSTTSSCG